jgi:hypothetical protein
MRDGDIRPAAIIEHHTASRTLRQLSIEDSISALKPRVGACARGIGLDSLLAREAGRHLRAGL